MPEETASERGESPSEAAGLRGPRGKTSAACALVLGSVGFTSRRRRPAAPERSKGAKGLRSPRSKTGGLAEPRRETNAEPQAERAGSRSRETRQGAALGTGPWKPPACGAVEATAGRRNARQYFASLRRIFLIFEKNNAQHYEKIPLPVNGFVCTALACRLQQTGR